MVHPKIGGSLAGALLLAAALTGITGGTAHADVWVPPVTSPTASAVWEVGGSYQVTWDTSTKPAKVTNPTGKIYLGHVEKGGGVSQDANPLISGFQLSDGEVSVMVPDDTVPGTYVVVLYGDSGNYSPQFSIKKPLS